MKDQGQIDHNTILATCQPYDLDFQCPASYGRDPYAKKSCPIQSDDVLINEKLILAKHNPFNPQ